MQEFLAYITGHLTWPHTLAGVSFVLLGLLLTVLADISQRNRKSLRTPFQWSWRFFWNENTLRFILNLITAIALIRFWPDISGGNEIGMFHCLCIGFGFDTLYITVREIRKPRASEPPPTPLFDRS
jgi:hypothetical protein